MDSKLVASFEKKIFYFKNPSGTSRGVLTEKYSWFIQIKDPQTLKVGVGECSVIPGLSPDYIDNNSYEKKLNEVCKSIDSLIHNLDVLAFYPSILFGIETALLDLNSSNSIFFDTPFSRGEIGIPINGLIWMGSKEFMLQQIEDKLVAGYSCLKMKIGAINFDEELDILASIRDRYSASDIELRVDANGAFSPKDVFERFEKLSKFELHSIEQPIYPGQIELMTKLCKETPIPIALDEELIGIVDYEVKRKLLTIISPQYIILKPSLHGGISGCMDWISLAESLSIPWWMTSALESNVGLNCIAQFTATFENTLPQGLGTGELYKNNIKSNLRIDKGILYFC